MRCSVMTAVLPSRVLPDVDNGVRAALLCRAGIVSVSQTLDRFLGASVPWQMISRYFSAIELRLALPQPLLG